MTLQQLFDWCNTKSYFSRDDDEVWEALNTAALQIYTEVLNENQGYFRAYDTTSLILVANQEEYPLPASVETIVRLRERLAATNPWAVISPADINSAAVEDSQFTGADESLIDSSVSIFSYVGPYQLIADEKAGTYVKNIRISPIPLDGPRMTELVYTAVFVEIEGNESPLIIDPPGHNALKYLAVAELLAAQDDSNAERFEAKGNVHKTQYLKLVRARQQQEARHVIPYLDDLD